MKGLMYFHLETMEGRRHALGDVEITLEPLKTREDLKTLLGIVLPSLKDDVVENLWVFLHSLYDYPIGDRVVVDVGNYHEGLDLDITVWQEHRPLVRMSFEENSMPYERFSSLVKMSLPHLPEGRDEALWKGVTGLFAALKTLGYEDLRVKMGVEKKGRRKIKIRRR